MKKVIYDRHPVMITKGLLATGEDWAGQVMLEIIDALLDNGSLSSGWGQLNLHVLCAAQGIDVPDGAAAIVLDVEVEDADGAANPYNITFGYGGLVDATNFPGRAFVVYTKAANDQWISRLVVLPFDEDGLIDFVVTASGGTTFDYRLRLIGWVILGEDYVKPTSPQEDLLCGFTVNQ